MADHHLGANVRRRRRELELSQTDLADKVGVHLNTICRIERGHRRPKLALLERMAAALRVSPADLALAPAPAGEDRV